MNKYDRRRKYYLVLDCETATLPIANEYENEVQKKRISIMKPLIYELGWTVIDSKGNIYAKKNYLISEIFSVPSIFDTAYYKDKRNLYLDKLQKGEIVLTSWLTASRELIEDLQAVEGVGAYNSMFDYKKAIPFTDLYISMLYSPDFHSWLAYQEQICIWLADGGKPMNEEENKDFEPLVFRYKETAYPLFDIWGLACSHLLDCAEYKQRIKTHNGIIVFYRDGYFFCIVRLCNTYIRCRVISVAEKCWGAFDSLKALDERCLETT